LKGKEIAFTGLSTDSEVSVYGLTGNLLLKSPVYNNQTISLENLKESLVLVRVSKPKF